MADNPILSFILDHPVLTTYTALAGAYLFVIPVLVTFYVDLRWNFASSIERLLLFVLTFFFYPGILVVGGFINHRPRLRNLD